jgi:hypothetical protein
MELGQAISIFRRLYRFLFYFLNKIFFKKASGGELNTDVLSDEIFDVLCSCVKIKVKTLKVKNSV